MANTNITNNHIIALTIHDDTNNQSSYKEKND